MGELLKELQEGVVGMLNARIESGIDWIINVTNFEEQLKMADVVITGEGRLDHQSLAGKVVSGVLKLATQQKKKIMIFAGTNELGASQLKQAGISKVLTTKSLALNQEDSINNAGQYLTRIIREIIIRKTKWLTINVIDSVE